MHSLDLRGLSCPVPLLRAKKHIQEMSPGDKVMIRSTEDKFGEDIHDLCKLLDANVEALNWKAGVVTVLIEK